MTSPSADPQTDTALSEIDDWQEGGFGLYLHWPFCESKCPYCDFNSHVAGRVDQSKWQDAFVQEIRRYASETKGRILSSVYFGGGTPSLMEHEVVAAILEEVRASWATVNDLEVTLEANPGSVEAARFSGYRRAGVNRVSLGVQALDDLALRALGRLHSKAEALKALDIARSTFDRVSFDLIYARQDQTLTEWKSELTEALSIASDHISLYQLTVEDGTVFASRAEKGKLKGLPSEDLAADMYEATQDICNNAGIPAYEVSNHARPDSESRHNLTYWRSGDYVGIGPGAHGRISHGPKRSATEAYRDPAKWMTSVTTGPGGEQVRNLLDHQERALEYLLMSLRTNEGLDLNRYERIANRPLPQAAIQNLMGLGLVQTVNQRLMTTAAGRLVLNGVLKELATD